MPKRSLCTVSAMIVILVVGLLGCSGGGGGPTMPGVTGTDVENPSLSGGNGTDYGPVKGDRQLWGLWLMHVNADHTAIDVEPVREANFHLNVVGYLENPYPTQLLKIVGVSWSEYDTLEVQIQLHHPFGSNKLTGRDVRGIAILPYVKGFPGTWLIDEDANPTETIYASRWLLNADGYTTLWNRWTAEEVQHPQLFGYIRGKLATPDEYFIQGNLHGFRTFYTDSKEHVFQCNQGATRKYEFDFPPGPLTFAYAVDVSWEPMNTPFEDIWDDFPITANCSEPYQISASITNNTLTKIGGSADVIFDVKDWQDPTNFSHVHVESPDLFFGTLDLTAIGPSSYPDANTARYNVTINNTTGEAATAKGGSDLLIVVEDIDNSTANPDLTAYQIVKIPVQDVSGYWRDRNGDNSFVNVPLAAPLVLPSSLSAGMPDLAIVSYPEEECGIFSGKPELMLFDDNDSRFIVYNRTLDATDKKSGYPFSSPPSWLLYPHCMDANNSGWFGVGSTNETTVDNYQVKHLINMFTQCGIYGRSWHTGTWDGTPGAFRETIRDVTAGMGNVTGDPVYGLFAYDSGAVPTEAYVLQVGYPYIAPPPASNTLRCWIPLANAGFVPQAIYPDAERLRCGIDTQPVGLSVNRWAFYVVESNPSTGTSEIEGFEINFMYFDPNAIWNLTDAQIKTEFPGAWAVDCEVVPSLTNHVILIGETTAQYNWLCVLMTDGVDYWLTFYDPLNPSPDNPGNTNLESIYTSNKLPIMGGGFELAAVDVDHQYFEVYVLCRDATDSYYISVFEFFY